MSKKHRELTVAFRVTPCEKQTLEQKAKENGYDDVSKYIRKIIRDEIYGKNVQSIKDSEEYKRVVNYYKQTCKCNEGFIKICDELNKKVDELTTDLVESYIMLFPKLNSDELHKIALCVETLFESE